MYPYVDVVPHEPLHLTLAEYQQPTQWPSDTLIVFESGPGGPTDRDLWMLNLSDPDNPRAEAYLSSEVGLSSIKVSRDGTLAAYLLGLKFVLLSRRDRNALHKLLELPQPSRIRSPHHRV